MNRPELVVVAVLTRPVRVSVIRTDTPAAGPPSGAEMLPLIADVVSCAFPATGTLSSITVANRATLVCFSAARADPYNRELCFIFGTPFWKVAKAYATTMTIRFRSFSFRPISGYWAENSDDFLVLIAPIYRSENACAIRACACIRVSLARPKRARRRCSRIRVTKRLQVIVFVSVRLSRSSASGPKRQCARPIGSVQECRLP